MGNTEQMERDTSLKLPEVLDGNGFVELLKQENIQDLNDSRVNTKIVNNIVIIIIDGKECFSVKGKNNFDQFKHIFEETQSITYKTQQELYTIEQDIELNPTDFQARIDTYKEFYKKQKQESKSKGFWLNSNSAGKEKTAYKITAQEADIQLTKLKKIEERFHQLSKANRYENKELGRIEREVSMKQLSKELDEVWAKMPEFTQYRNDIAAQNLDAITTPPFRMTINSVSDAKRIRDILKNFNEQNTKSNEYAADGATQAQYAQTLQSMASYFEEMINNPQAFYPYNFDAQQLAAINYFPELKKTMETIDPNRPVDQHQTENNTSIENTQTKEGSPVGPTENTPEYKDWKEALAKGGVAGLLESTVMKNMTAEQKKTWGGIGNLAITGVTIFAGFKFLSTAWKALSEKGRKELDEKGGWNWLWLPPAAIFAANAATGESPLALLKGGKASAWLAGLFGNSSNEAGNNGNNGNILGTSENTPESQEKMGTDVEDMTSVMALFHGKTGSEIIQAIELDPNSGKMKLKTEVYKQIIEDAKNNPDDLGKKTAAAALEKIGEDDSRHIVDMGLTLCGFSYESLTTSKSGKDVFDEKATNAGIRVAQVTEFMNQNKFDRINTNQYELVRKFIANPNGSEEDLRKLLERGDVFENSKDLPPENTRKSLKEQLNKLTISEQEKGSLLASINTFWHLWSADTDTKNKLTISEQGEHIIIKTYNKESKIDIKTNTIPGLVDKNGKEIRFSSTVEAIKAANLVNRAFDLTKELSNPPTANPFNISLLGRDVEYDNTKFWSSISDKYNHKDITIISGGIGGALKEISPALEENKSEFVNYLNKQYNTIHNL